MSWDARLGRRSARPTTRRNREGNSGVTFPMGQKPWIGAILPTKTTTKTYENDSCLYKNCSAPVGSGNPNGHVWARGHLFVDKLPIRYPRRCAARRSKP